MPIEVLDVLDPASWHAYGMVYGFAGNELLTPMNRSHNLQGLDPGFWATMPRPETADGIDGLARLEAYAAKAALHAGENQPAADVAAQRGSCFVVYHDVSPRECLVTQVAACLFA